MTVNVLLRVVLDQLVSPTDPDLAMASAQLAYALVQTAPTGCEVGAIVPSGPNPLELPGIAEIRQLGMRRRELAAAWQLGMTAGTGGGLIHSPTLLAPLARHDRANDHDQIVVTLWGLRPWEHPEEFSRAERVLYKTMLKRARKHADAIVVPTHAMAARLAEFAAFGDRIRVIAGAAPARFAVPSDALGRRRTLMIPEAVLVLVGNASPSSALPVGFAAIAAAGVDLPIVVLDVRDGEEAEVMELARGAGIPEPRVHVHAGLDAADRAAILDAAVLVVAPTRRSGFPWRLVEAMALGVPVIATASADHRAVVLDGGRLVGDDDGAARDVPALAEAIGDAVASVEALERLGVLAGDRGRVFSWRSAAERVWQLHADL